MARKIIPMIGKVFTELTVIEFAYSYPNSRVSYWRCRCSCGKILDVDGSKLRRGLISRCDDCRAKIFIENIRTHDMSNESIYIIWRGLLARCNNPNNTRYQYYGGRGITTDPSWDRFEQFYADMGDRPEGLEIDRIDNSKGYSKDNCRWVTHKENMNNRRPFSEWTIKVPRKGMKYNTKKKRESAALLASITQ